jgi:type IV secretory pathway TrbF-like protein
MIGGLQRLFMNRAATDAAAGNGRNPVLDPNAIDYSIGDRADRNATSWRRFSFALLAVILILAVGYYQQATMRHDYVAVFSQDAKGETTYIGQAEQAANPTNQYDVEKHLSEWVKCFRNIPNGDPVLVQQNGDCAFALLSDQNSQAYHFVVRELQTYPPLRLNGEHRIHRDVDRVVVSPISPLTYALQWREYIYNGADLWNELYQKAVVTLAAPPQIPAGGVPTEQLRLNPDGITISNIDPHWQDVLPQ